MLMMRRMMLLAVVVLAVAPMAFAATPQRPQPGDCVDASIIKPLTNLFPSQFQVIGSQTAAGDTVQVTVAKDFQVSYYDTYKVVTNTMVNETYVLYQCGLAAPAAGAPGVPAGAKFFEIPLTGVSVPDTTSAAFLVALNVMDRVSYVTNMVDEPCLQSLALSTGCNLQATGDTSPDISNNNAVAAVFDGFSANSAVSKAIAFTASSDPGPLNRAEWIKFMAMFFNKESDANADFASVRQNYNLISSAAKQAAATQPKLMAWIMWWPASPEFGLYDVPSIQINFPAFKVNLTQDAGANIVDLVYAQKFVTTVRQPFGSNSVFLLINETDILRQLLADVDVVIDEARYFDNNNVGTADVNIDLNAFLKQYGLSASDIPNLKFLRNNGLLREDGVTNPGSWNEWFGMAVVRPDQVLADLTQALNPSVLQQQPLQGLLNSNTLQLQLSKPLFLRNLAKSQGVVLKTYQQCNQMVGCSLPANAICPNIYLGCDGSLVYATATQRCAPSCPVNAPAPSTESGPAAARPFILAAIGAVLLSLLLGCAMAC